MLKKMMTVVLALVMVVTAIAPATVQAATKKVAGGIYIASFDSSKKNHVESVKSNKDGQLVVKANFSCGTPNEKTGIMEWKSTGMKTFTLSGREYGNGIDGGADYHLHNYKNGKKNPKFYHYTQEEFIKSVDKRYGTSWKLVLTVTSDGELTSAAIVKYSGEWKDTQRKGYKEGTTNDERAWASMTYTKDGTAVGYGPEAEKYLWKRTYDGEIIR